MKHIRLGEGDVYLPGMVDGVLASLNAKLDWIGESIRVASDERQRIDSLLTEQVKDSKAVTDDVKKWKLMGIGALGVVGLGGAALGVTLANSFEWLARLLHK